MREELEWVHEAFYALTASRRSGMTVGPIPFEAIDAYARRYSIDEPEDFEEFHRLLRAADAAYLDVVHEKTARSPDEDTRDQGAQNNRR